LQVQQHKVDPAGRNPRAGISAVRGGLDDVAGGGQGRHSQFERGQVIFDHQYGADRIDDVALALHLGVPLLPRLLPPKHRIPRHQLERVSADSNAPVRCETSDKRRYVK
jgi:hypothetical protein